MNVLHVTPYYPPAYAFGGVTRAVEGMVGALIRRGHSVTVLTTDAYTQGERLPPHPSEALSPQPPHPDGEEEKSRAALSKASSLRSSDELKSTRTGDLKPLSLRERGWGEGVTGETVIRVPNLSVWLRGRANLSTPLGMGRAARPLLEWADVVHVHEFRTLENLLVTPTAARLGKPLALSPHGTLTTETGRGAFKTVWDRLFSPAVARRFRAVIGLTQAEAADARALWAELGAQADFPVVPNGIDPDEFAHLPDRAAFRAQYGLGDAPVCLFLGRLHPRKGVEALVRAFKAADVPGAQLVIAGPDDGALASIQPLLDKRITLTGYLAGEARLAALAAADVFALPATGEGLSMASLEAMAAGLPVLLSPGCNLPEAGDAGAGLIAPPEVDPLAEALRTLLTDPVRRAAMGAAGRALVRDRFTWDAVAAALEAVYAGIAS